MLKRFNIQIFYHKLTKKKKKKNTMNQNYVIGLDFGSDSVRCLITNVQTGEEISSSVICYPRWTKGRYCNPAENRYRQHPLDYTEAMEECVKNALKKCNVNIAKNIIGIGYDTTASTPVLIDRDGTPLSILDDFSEDPDAMFVLWKDHTAIKEAEEINEAIKSAETDYAKYSGGSYSCEWVWSKMLHILRQNKKIRKKAWSWVEHCDWIGGILTGNTRPETIYRSRCTAGHKAMWNADWGGLPPMSFFKKIDPLYSIFEDHLFSDTVVPGHCIGGLCESWAKRLGLKPGIAIAMGAIDCHAGAIGVGIAPGTLVKVIGTSTCDITIASSDNARNAVKGICGQVDSSVVPGLIGYEAGQSAFGDIYAWFKRLMEWTLELVPEEYRPKAENMILGKLNEEAARLPLSTEDPVALDWHNGRRAPDLNPNLKGAVYGLTLATTAPQLYKAFVEATAFGARAINERFIKEGVDIKEIIATGGIAKKSPYIMQVLADVIGTSIKVSDSCQPCALGGCIYAAVASGIYSEMEDAEKKMQSKCSVEYHPDSKRHKIYDILYKKYITISCKTERTE